MKPLQPYNLLAKNAGVSIRSPHLYRSAFPLAQLYPIYWTKHVVDKLAYLCFVFVLIWGWVSAELLTPIEASLPSITPLILFFILWFGGAFIIGLLLIAVITLITATKLGTPKLELSDIVLYPDDSFDIHYRQHIKNEMTLNSLSFALLLRESVTEGSGRGQKTIHHDTVIFEDNMSDVTVSPDQPIDYTQSYTIPTDAPPSYEATDNKILWILQVKMSIPNFPDFQHELLLQVTSEVRQ